MPDLFGYDARTVKSKLAGQLFSAAVPLAAQSIYKRLMAPGARKKIHGRYGRYRRRRTFKRTAKRKGAQFKRRGRRYTGPRRRHTYARLDTNFTRNDYRTLRGVYSYFTGLEVREGALLQNNFVYQLNPSLFDQFTTNQSRFREFKLTNVQFVLEPRSIITGDQRIRVSQGDIPYLAVRTVNASDASPTNVDRDDVRRTPGYTYVPLARKRRTIINHSPSITLVTEVAQVGADVSTSRQWGMPWLPCRTAGSLNLGSLEIRVPQLDVQNGDIIQWDVRMYATLRFRGAIEDVVDPIEP